MWKLSLFSLICLVYATVFGQGILTTSSPIKSEAELDRIAEDFLSSFKLAHSKTSRKKRHLNEALQKLIDDNGVSRLQTVVPVSRLCSPAVYTKFLDVWNETYAICATEATADSSAEIFVGTYKDTKWQIQWRWFVSNPKGLSAFCFNEYIYVLVADADNEEGTPLVQINTVTRRKVEDHKVFSKYITSLAIWNMKVDNKYHMAIANSGGGRQNTADLVSDVSVFEWTAKTQLLLSMTTLKVVLLTKTQCDSNIHTVIYKFVNDRFVTFQCLKSPLPVSISTWSSESTFLLAVASLDAVYLYQYDGWQFVSSSVQYSQGSMSTGVTHLEFHKIIRENVEVVILSVSNPRQYSELSVFEIGFKYENALQTWNDKSLEWCFDVLGNLESTKADLTLSLFNDVVFADQPSPITINGSLYFEGGFEAGKLETPQLKEIVTKETYNSNMLIGLKDLKRRLQEMESKINKFEEVLNNSLKIEGNQTVYGELRFKDVVFNCSRKSCQFNTIHTVLLNEDNITDWSKNLIFLDRDQVIDGTLFVENITANDINVSGMIDGIDSRTLVTRFGNHNITGPKTFNTLYVSDLEVHGLVDGVRISPDNVLLTTGHQIVNGNLTFGEIDASWLEVEGMVNGVNLIEFYSDVVLSDQPSVITGKKRFHDIVVDNLIMNPGSTINGIDFIDLWENALWVDGSQRINAQMTFNSMGLQKNLYVPHGINGIQIPGPRVVNINEFANVTAPHFFQESTIAQLNVMKSLNGLETFEIPGMLPRLDILLKNGSQVVTGKKTLHNIHLDADSTVQGTVNGVDLSEFKNMVLSRHSSKDPNSVWKFNNLKIKGPLTVKNINGLDIGNIYERALKLNDTDLPEMTFEDIVYIKELESYNINGINIEKDLVLLNKAQNITGRKVFQEIILEENSVIVETVNNLNISFLTETVLRIGNQALKSKVFDGNVKFNKLTVKGSINDVPISEFVTLSGNETLLQSRELINVTFKDIDAHNLHVVGTVNGINIENMMRDTMTYGGHEEVTGKKTIKGTIHVSNGDDLRVDNINGVNIDKLWEDSVLLDVPQTIAGTKTFKSSVFIDNLKFKTIDGISEDHMRDWMLKNTPQVVENDVVFTKGLSIRNLTVLGQINGEDIKELDASIVKTNEPSVIEGSISFENRLISNGDVLLTGLIQGIDLSEEVITRFGDKVITGVKTFAQDLVIEKDATVNGFVDGVLIEELCQKALLINEQNITHLTIKGDVTFLRGGLIGGKVAGVDLQELHKIAVTLADDGLKFPGGKTFENLTIEGPVKLVGTLGGVDLQLLNSTYMSLTRNQEIPARMSFDEVHFKETLSVKRLNTEDQKINDIDISSLKRVLRTDTTQTVTAAHHFENIIVRGDVLVTGKVNGLEIPSGLMRHNHTNKIESSKMFEKPVHVEGDLVMDEGKKIQSVDVSKWFQTAVLKDGGIFKIDGFKIFNNLSLVNASVGGLLNDLEISKDSLLMTYGTQTVTGKKTIRGNVDIGGSLTVNGLVNGIDLLALSTRTLQRGRENTITGIKQFSEPLTVDSLEAPTVAGVDIKELKRKIDHNIDFEPLKNRLQEIGDVVTKMNDAINKQAIVFQYYELFQEFNIPMAYNLLYVYGDDCGELLLLLDNSSSIAHCSSILLLEFSHEQGIFIAHPQELVASSAVTVKSIFVWGSTYLFVANQNSNSLCSNGADSGSEDTTSDIYIWHGNQFELFQRIEIRPIAHMVVFYDGNLCCVVYIELQECKVYCSEGNGMHFQFRETLPTSGGKKASIIQADEKIIMAISADVLDAWGDLEGAKSVDIYYWNFELSAFSSAKQVIGSTFAQSVLLMSYANEYSSSNIFLVVAEGRIPKVQNEPNLKIYRFDGKSNLFMKYQEIEDYGELEWIVLQTGELVLFVLNSHQGKLKLYQYKGASGFVNIDTINSLGSVNIHPFIRHEDKEGVDHFLALAGPRALMAQPSQGTDYAKLLKSKMKGNRYFINNELF
ncbi:tspear [Trichonephila inaurata madagascariensis]|uniref:Tspear n=1 Tax=Trichonephila inaurata madagascariensis TaxID=2747483 RepID=A0A8X6YSH9_9ARAC|nr:tspear [Trichonephila inaurata madagascariensis]